MFTKREGLTERAEIEVRQRALKSLVLKRNKLLRESLDQRIKRAGKQGIWATLSRSECRDLHRQEIAHLRVQLADLHLEWAYSRLEMRKLKRALTRAERLKAARRAPRSHPAAVAF
jgi:hypothetical protein